MPRDPFVRVTPSSPLGCLPHPPKLRTGSAALYIPSSAPFLLWPNSFAWPTAKRKNLRGSAAGLQRRCKYGKHGTFFNDSTATTNTVNFTIARRFTRMLCVCKYAYVCDESEVEKVFLHPLQPHGFWYCVCVCVGCALRLYTRKVEAQS